MRVLVWFDFGFLLGVIFLFCFLFGPFLLSDSFSFYLISLGRSLFQLPPTMHMLFLYGGTEISQNSSVHPSLKFLITQKYFSSDSYSCIHSFCN